MHEQSAMACVSKVRIDNECLDEDHQVVLDVLRLDVLFGLGRGHFGQLLGDLIRDVFHVLATAPRANVFVFLREIIAF